MRLDVSLSLLLVLLLAAGCELPNAATSDAGADGGGECGGASCKDSEVCLLRACTDEERCQPSTSCPAGWTPSDCGGRPGCLSPQCAPRIQGCRAIPASCGGDVQCACESICGSVARCAEVDGKAILCAE